MKALAIVVNIFFPGVGTLFVKKWIQAIIQIVLSLIAIILIITIIGMFIGIPLMFIVWIWAIISAATAEV